MIEPGSTIGILGGGQLGRMLAVAAAQLGYRTHVLAPDRESVAAQTASSLTRADYHNRIVLADFAGDYLIPDVNLPVGVVTGAVGAPLMLAVIITAGRAGKA